MSLVFLVCLAKAEASNQSRCVNIDGDERYCFIVKNEIPDSLTDVKISVDSSYTPDNGWNVFHDYKVANIPNIDKLSETPQLTERPLELHGAGFHAIQNTWTIKYKRNGVSYGVVFDAGVYPSDLGGDFGCIVHIYSSNKVMLEAPHKQFGNRQAIAFDPATQPDPTCVGGDGRFCFVMSNRTHEQLTNVRTEVFTDYGDIGSKYHEYATADIETFDDKPTDTGEFQARPLLADTNDISQNWQINYMRGGVCYGTTFRADMTSDHMKNYGGPAVVAINIDNSIGILGSDGVNMGAHTAQPQQSPDACSY